MKKLCTAVLALSLCGLFIPAPPAAAENGEGQQATQAYLARKIADVTGLSPKAGTNPGNQDYFRILSLNGIAPEGGWDAEGIVTRALLARVVVQALGLTDLIDDPDDPKAYIDLLDQLGIPINTVGQAMNNISPIPDPLGYEGGASDPLDTEKVPVEPDTFRDGTPLIPPIPPIIISEEEINLLITAATEAVVVQRVARRRRVTEN